MSESERSFKKKAFLQTWAVICEMADAKLSLTWAVHFHFYPLPVNDFFRKPSVNLTVNGLLLVQPVHVSVVALLMPQLMDVSNVLVIMSYLELVVRPSVTKDSN